MKLIIGTLMWMLLLGMAGHASGQWQFAGWYGSGCFPNVVFDPNVKDRLYLASDVSGLWRSDDLGEHWEFATNGLGHFSVTQVAVAPSDSNVLYAGTQGGTYVSKDAARTWTKLNDLAYQRPENYRSIIISPTDAAHVCMGSFSGEVRCTHAKVDGGGKSLTNGKPVAALQFSGQKLLIASSHGLAAYNFETSSGQLLDNAPKNITDFVVSSQEPHVWYAAGSTKLWISKDQGVNWTESNPVPLGTTYRIALDESQSPPIVRVIANQDWKGGVFKSIDEGKTWSAENNIQADFKANPTRQFSQPGGKSTGLAVNPFDPDILFRTDWWGAYRSDDNGGSWQEKIIGAPNIVSTQVTITAGGELFVAGMDVGLLRSLDAGKTYQPLFPTQWDPDRSGHVWRVAVAQDRVWVTSSPWDKQLNQVAVSEDRGKTFTLSRSGLPPKRPRQNTMWGEGYPRALAVDPADPKRLYLGIDGDDGGGLFISTDGGYNWQRSAGQPGSLRVFNGLAVDPTDPKRVVWGASGKNGGVYVSNDRAASFQHTLWQMQWVFDVAVGPDGTMYAAGDSDGGKLYASLNHGKTWKVIKSFGKGHALSALAIDPGNAQRIAVATTSWGAGEPGKIYLSKDNGKKWQEITGNLPSGGGASAMTFDSQGALYIGQNAGSVYKLLP